MTETDTPEGTEVAHTTSPELRERDPETAPDPVDTTEAESLDEVHAMAAYTRAVMGPAADDPTIATPGTDPVPEPGPGPEDNEALDNATGGALSNAAETGTAWPEPRDHDSFANKGELEARKDENIGIKTTFDLNAPGEQGDVEGDDGSGEFDPGNHTVAEVQDYLDAHPEEEERVLAAEANGKNRAGIVG
jgi:hypothetical protein